jgi:hypothetical protein
MLFSNTLSLRSSLGVSDQVSHPYKTTGKILVLRVYVVHKFFARYDGDHGDYCNKEENTIMAVIIIIIIIIIMLQ